MQIKFKLYVCRCVYACFYLTNSSEYGIFVSLSFLSRMPSVYVRRCLSLSDPSVHVVGVDSG